MVLFVRLQDAVQQLLVFHASLREAGQRLRATADCGAVFLVVIRQYRQSTFRPKLGRGDQNLVGGRAGYEQGFRVCITERVIVVQFGKTPFGVWHILSTKFADQAELVPAQLSVVLKRLFRCSVVKAVEIAQIDRLRNLVETSVQIVGVLLFRYDEGVGAEVLALDLYRRAIGDDRMLGDRGELRVQNPGLLLGFLIDEDQMSRRQVERAEHGVVRFRRVGRLVNERLRFIEHFNVRYLDWQRRDRTVANQLINRAIGDLAFRLCTGSAASSNSYRRPVTLTFGVRMISISIISALRLHVRT